MSQELLLGASAALGLIYLLFMTRSEPTVLRSVVKTGSIALLAVVAMPVPLLALALGLSALGDLALSRNGERAFLAGIGAFASATQDIVMDAWRVDVADDVATIDRWWE